MKQHRSRTSRSRRDSLVLVLLRVLIVVTLGIDAVIHARLAPGYQSAAPDGIGEGNLFYIEAAAAAAAALYVLVRPGKAAYLAALVFAVGGLGVLLLYRYIDVPAFGPFPAMYEPVWFTEKTLTALAQAVATVAAATALHRTRLPKKSTEHPREFLHHGHRRRRS
ncbi:hypothetical protein [Arthrobacter sp. fls2-241-R2A-200]|uniref:hypothetical protein n=1 Tax=Arthrobacter sp. fls2-241-R2A-200 TaxID=3040281 RepID=UPI00254D5361|nr:hypothetical protein [Arthrobacter sp. fls2-241-R2A-200]